MAGSAPVCVIPNNKVTSRKPCCSGDWLGDWLGNFSSAQDFAMEWSPATCLFSLSFLILLFSSITLFTPFPMSGGFVDFYRAHGPMALSRYRMISISVLSNLPSFCKQAESPKWWVSGSNKLALSWKSMALLAKTRLPLWAAFTGVRHGLKTQLSLISTSSIRLQRVATSMEPLSAFTTLHREFSSILLQQYLRYRLRAQHRVQAEYCQGTFAGCRKWG